MSDWIRVDEDAVRELVRQVAREEIEASREKSTPAGRYLSTGEAADILAVSERTIQRMCLSGELPAVQLGNRWKVRLCDLPTPEVDSPDSRE